MSYTTHANGIFTQAGNYNVTKQILTRNHSF